MKLNYYSKGECDYPIPNAFITCPCPTDRPKFICLIDYSLSFFSLISLKYAMTFETDSSFIEMRNFEIECSWKRIQNFLLENIDKLPGSWIDQLIQELGGPQQVAEISNRKVRGTVNSDGEVTLYSNNISLIVKLWLFHP